MGREEQIEEREVLDSIFPEEIKVYDFRGLLALQVASIMAKDSLY